MIAASFAPYAAESLTQAQELAARGTLAQSTLQLHALQEEDGEESL